MSEKRIEANIPLHLELLPYNPITLLLSIKNMDVCKEAQKGTHTTHKTRLYSWLPIPGIISLLASRRAYIRRGVV